MNPSGSRKRHYQAILSFMQTVAAMKEYHKYYISVNLTAEIERLQSAFHQELVRIEEETKKAEEALKR